MSSNHLTHDQRMAWWRDAKVGLFIHWGPYADVAGTWQGRKIPWGTEWIRHSARAKREDYEAMARAWSPREFDANHWADVALRAGMKYLVLTTKHHDGFCLWDTATTDFKLPQGTGIDVLESFAPACRERGLRIGWYYSPRDWHHPDFLPRYEMLEVGEDRRIGVGFKASEIVGPADMPCGCYSCREGELFTDDPMPAGGRVVSRYYSYLREQLDELMTRYGPIDVLWFDGQDARPDFFPADDIVQQLRAHRSELIINDRLGMPPWQADFGIHENVIPETGETRDWESCDTMNYTWGHGEDWTEWCSPRKMIHDCCDIVSKGGNYLINVGPDGEGRIPEAVSDRLEIFGQWLARYGEGIYGTRRADARLPLHPGVRFTQKGDDVFVFQLEDPGTDVWLAGWKMLDSGGVEHLADGHPIRFENHPERGLRIRVAELPVASWVGQAALGFRLRGVMAALR